MAKKDTKLMAETALEKYRHRQFIRAEIEVKFGGTLSDFAAANRLNRDTLYKSFVQRTPTANRKVAEFLGVRLHDLWPHWYHRDGSLIPGVNSKLTRYRVERTKVAA